MNKQGWVEQPDGYLNKVPILQFILVTILFAMWAIAASLNDILITQFTAVFDLSGFAAAFVKTAFYGGYFVIAIPASIFIKKSSYKLGIVAGLTAFALGCFLFFPAARLFAYPVFLFALFVEAIGLSFLETSANTYSSLLGPRSSSTVRLNVSQTMNAIGNIIGIFLGKYLIFTDDNLTQKMSDLSKSAAEEYGRQALARTISPYKYLLIVLAILIIIFALTKFPSGKPKKKEYEKNVTFAETMNYLKDKKEYWQAVITQFLYAGVQTSVWSYTMILALEMFPQFNERTVSNFMLYSYICFFVGRVSASYLLARFSETKVLLTYSSLGTLAVLYATLVPNVSAVYAVIGVNLFMGPCWPTIYSRALDKIDDKRHTETAGAFIVMALVGGAILPALQGLLSDYTNIQFSFILVAIEFLCVALYFFKERKGETKKQD
ncbi:MAG: L-fucose:H+ symporter permease [Staphylococcus equorum]|uniref:L-fucose:H+ symporter permease n=1 Tax=Tetragenococcus halophilus TaxID=51669 RepID=A0A3G5FHK7_TETHA|nr:L-fucose:H+ symporter permease [Tetragenococcus halophilus]MDN6161820.1 L-fucose:H+ symporter permease [Atopostipes sp.]MDN6721074.1 L-fucose:H+ symporter permease [Staphylococcus equorum]AYW49820.1 L-fucose:H+ symporter permease [Tetragenococcus halophilus]GBD63857.1 hypothetical protein TEHD23766T_1284 [Tetragenococcus halophilus subsp. flandriensis]GFK21380.1 sugar:proton symporter [Tetragenococcus halophilus]